MIAEVDTREGKTICFGANSIIINSSNCGRPIER